MAVFFQAFKEKFFQHTIGSGTPLINCNQVIFISLNRELKDYDNLSTIPTEIDRIAINSSNMSFLGKRFTFNFTIADDKCICPTSIITAKSSDSTIITLTSGTAAFFEVGNLCEIETSTGFIEASIIAKSGNNITIDSPKNAIIGGLCRKKVTHIIILCNATSSPNSLDLFFISFQDKFYKDSSAPQEKKLIYEFR